MLEGLICTAACGDALFVVLARPAQPLIAAALKITGPSSAMKFDFPRFPVTVTFPEVPLADSPLTIFPSGTSIRGQSTFRNRVKNTGVTFN